MTYGGARFVKPLDGRWEIRFDPLNRGKQERWWQLHEPAAETDDWAVDTIRVPSCWEEIRPGYDGVAWYYRTFEVEEGVPASYERFFLKFDAVNYYCEVWLNAARAGEHEGGYTPFELDVTEQLRAGRNRLVVRVLDPPKDERGIDGFVLKETPCWRELESFNFGGVWQSVQLIGARQIEVRDVFVRPHIDRDSVTVELDVANHAAEAVIALLQLTVASWSVAAAPAATVESTAVLEPGDSIRRYEMRLTNPVLWSPENPHLYEIRLAVSENGSVLDERMDRFGFRELTIRDDRFVLNGRPRFIKGGFHEGLYPITIAYPPNRELVVKEIGLAKEMGFDLLRFWQIPVHPMVLDVADEMGMMICDEPPIEWMSESPHLRRRCLREVRELVLRDRNRASVVMWTILNESGHLADFDRIGVTEPWHTGWLHTEPYRIRDELALLARQLDPTRIVIDESGGWLGGAFQPASADLDESTAGGANAYLPYQSAPTPLQDIHIYRPAPTGVDTYEHLNRLRTARGAIFVSEFGYGSIPDLHAMLEQYERADPGDATKELEDYRQVESLASSLDELFRRHDVSELFADPAEFCLATQRVQAEGNAQQILAQRSNPNIAGYVLHAYSAGGLILGAEVVDLWRNPKRPMYDMLVETQRPVALALSSNPISGFVGTPVMLAVSVVNDGPSLGETVLELRISRDGVAVGRQSCRINVGSGVTRAYEGKLLAGEHEGAYRIDARLHRDDMVVASVQRQLLLLEQKGSGATTGERGFHFWDPDGVVTERSAPPSADGEVGSRAIVALQPRNGWSRSGLRPELSRECQRVRQGGSLALLGPFAPEDAELIGSLLELELTARDSRGNWNPAAHYVTDHPVFAGLPSKTLMSQTYAEVVPPYAFVGRIDDAQSIAGCISMDATIFKRPTEFWWGSTLLAVPHGRGTVILSQLELSANVHVDPVANRLLSNIRDFAQSVA